MYDAPGTEDRRDSRPTLSSTGLHDCEYVDAASGYVPANDCNVPNN